MKFSFASVVALAALTVAVSALPTPRNVEIEARGDSPSTYIAREIDVRSEDLDLRDEELYSRDDELYSRDNELAVREDDLELRGAGGVADVLEEGIKIIVAGIQKLKAAIKQDKIVCLFPSPSAT